MLVEHYGEYAGGKLKYWLFNFERREKHEQQKREEEERARESRNEWWNEEGRHQWDESVNQFNRQSNLASCYQVLGVSPGSPYQVVKQQYKKLMKQWHPDLNPQPEAKEKSQEINIAWEQYERSINLARSHYEKNVSYPTHSDTEDILF